MQNARQMGKKSWWWCGLQQADPASLSRVESPSTCSIVQEANHLAAKCNLLFSFQREYYRNQDHFIKKIIRRERYTKKVERSRNQP